MGLVSTGFVGSITLKDSEGSVSTLQYNLVAATAADALTAMNTIVTRLLTVTDAVISGYSVAEVFAENALTLPTGVEIEKRAVISAKIASTFPQEYVNIIIPAPDDGIFLAATGPNARIVDATDSNLRTYLSTYESGGLATISDGQNIVETTDDGAFSGRKTHRGSRRG